MSAAGNFTRFIAGRKFRTILADPPRQFSNRTGKVAPEHRRLKRYATLSLGEICSIPVQSAAEDESPPVPPGPQRPFARWAGGHEGLGLQI